MIIQILGYSFPSFRLNSKTSDVLCSLFFVFKYIAFTRCASYYPSRRFSVTQTALGNEISNGLAPLFAVKLWRCRVDPFLLPSSGVGRILQWGRVLLSLKIYVKTTAQCPSAFATASKHNPSMGVGAQKDLGGHQTLARRMTLNFARKAIGFSVQNKVTSKKRSSTKLRRFFCPNLR